MNALRQHNASGGRALTFFDFFLRYIDATQFMSLLSNDLIDAVDQSLAFCANGSGIDSHVEK